MRTWTRQEARAFAARWLPAWTGNDPERLGAFYADDAFYSDPGIPAGVRGKAPLLAYFRKLLARNPEWTWTQIEGIPMEGGFLNKWNAMIPVGDETVECVGVCLVQFDAAGLISRNEVYFDRAELLAAVQCASRKR
ncbi:MAG TPA: nuclear transport factor 2 family protein [Candidatus Hydrogenedentes bacterium]|nr:nuclear transport factor 2 family protein [Candidatus Hydrogenedentota bacterium]